MLGLKLIHVSKSGHKQLLRVIKIVFRCKSLLLTDITYTSIWVSVYICYYIEIR